jgi:hypothetical protein
MDLAKLNEHKKLHVKVQCTKCRFTANTQTEVESHEKRMHATQFKCGMCEFSADSKDKLREHEKGFHKVTNYKCIQCDKSFTSSDDLKEHLDTTHRTNKKIFSYEERKRNGFCRFWNHSNCSFEKHCRFLHEEAPHCRFQDSCRAKQQCQFYHEDLHQQNPFLGQNMSQGYKKSPSGWTVPKTRKYYH